MTCWASLSPREKGAENSGIPSYRYNQREKRTLPHHDDDRRAVYLFRKGTLAGKRHHPRPKIEKKGREEPPHTRDLSKRKEPGSSKPVVGGLVLKTRILHRHRKSMEDLRENAFLKGGGRSCSFSCHNKGGGGKGRKDCSSAETGPELIHLTRESYAHLRHVHVGEKREKGKCRSGRIWYAKEMAASPWGGEKNNMAMM